MTIEDARADLIRSSDDFGETRSIRRATEKEASATRVQNATDPDQKGKGFAGMMEAIDPYFPWKEPNLVSPRFAAFAELIDRKGSRFTCCPDGSKRFYDGRLRVNISCCHLWL